MDCYLSALYEIIWKPRCEQIFDTEKEKQRRERENQNQNKKKRFIPNYIRKLAKSHNPSFICSFTFTRLG